MVDSQIGTSNLLPAPLARQIETAYGVRIGATARITRGIESVAWRGETERGPLAILLYPAWRTADELTWVHHLTVAVQRTVPEVVAPLPTADGGTLLRFEGRLVALFRFVEGEILDREDASLRLEAARLLARLHRAMREIPGLAPRPPSTSDAPFAWSPPPDPPELLDPEVDDLLAAEASGRIHLLTGPIHGDYYRGNVFTHNGRIAGIIDWNEARHDWLIKELAWCAWEFAKTSTSDDWHEDRARAFLTAYAEEGGPVPADEYRLVSIFVRYRLREEMRLYRAAISRGQTWWSSGYFESEVRALATLRARPALKL